MPYPNEHACRLKDPKQFKDIRRVNDKFAPGIDVLFGIDADGNDTEIQAIRFDASKFTADKARAWLKEHEFSCVAFEVAVEPEPEKADHAKLKTVDLDGEEVFSAGTWTAGNEKKPRTYTVDDLKRMADAARDLGSRFNAPVKLGHNDEQKLAKTDGVFGPDGKPAFGWMRNLRVIGDKLIADLKGVPAKLADLIQAGAFKNKSIEIYYDYNDETTGQKYPHVPCGLALLGDTLPALDNLNALAALYTTDKSIPGKTVFLFQTPPDDGGSNGGVLPMTPEEQKKMDELQAKCNQLMQENKELKDEYSKLKAEKANHDKTATDAAHKAEIDALKAEHEKEVNDLKKEKADSQKKLDEQSAEIAGYAQREIDAVLKNNEKKIPPVLREHFSKLLKDAKTQPAKFSMKVGEQEIKDYAALVDHIEKMPENPLFAEYGKDGGDRDGNTDGGEVDDKKVAAYCKDNKLNFENHGDYRKAVNAVLAGEK